MEAEPEELVGGISIRNRPSVVNSCESPPARFEDSKDQAWVALNHARMASESVLLLALATFSESNIRLALGDLNDISLEKRVNEAYQKINGQVKS